MSLQTTFLTENQQVTQFLSPKSSISANLPPPDPELTQVYISQIKEGKNLLDSISYLDTHYSGYYYSVLDDYYEINPEDKREYIFNKKQILYQSAITYQEDKSKFSSWLCENGYWNLSKITKNFYKNDILRNSKEIYDFCNEIHHNKSNEHTKFAPPKEYITDSSNNETHLLKEVEKIIENCINEKRNKEVYKEIWKLKIIN